MERTLEKVAFFLALSLVYIDSCELTVSVLRAVINTEKLANMLGTSWVGAHGSKSSLHIYRYTHFKREGDSMTSIRKGSYSKSFKSLNRQFALLSLTYHPHC